MTVFFFSPIRLEPISVSIGLITCGITLFYAPTISLFKSTSCAPVIFPPSSIGSSLSFIKSTFSSSLSTIFLLAGDPPFPSITEAAFSIVIPAAASPFFIYAA